MYVGPVPPYYAAVHLNLRNPDLDLTSLRIFIPVAPSLGNVYTNFGYSELPLFRGISSCGTDGRKGGRARHVIRPILHITIPKMHHNNVSE